MRVFFSFSWRLTPTPPSLSLPLSHTPLPFLCPPFFLWRRRHLAGPTGGWNEANFPDRVRSFLSSIQPVREELWGLYDSLGLKEKLA